MYKISVPIINSSAEILSDSGTDVGLALIDEKYNATTEYFDFLDNQYAVDNMIYDI